MKITMKLSPPWSVLRFWSCLLAIVAIDLHPSLATGSDSSTIRGYEAAIPGLCTDSTEHTLASLDTATSDACADICNNDVFCMAFSFLSISRPDQHNCVLANESCSSLDTNSSTTAVTYSVKDPPDGYRKRTGDCAGNDISFRKVSKVLACADLCSSLGGHCLGFLYHHDPNATWRNVPNCFVKSKSCDEATSANSNDFFYDLLPAHPPSETPTAVTAVPDGYWTRPGDCPGNDMLPGSVHLSLNACAIACTRRDACAGFVYVDDPDVDGARCLAKKELCLDYDPHAKKRTWYEKHGFNPHRTTDGASSAAPIMAVTTTAATTGTDEPVIKHRADMHPCKNMHAAASAAAKGFTMEAMIFCGLGMLILGVIIGALLAVIKNRYDLNSGFRRVLSESTLHL